MLRHILTPTKVTKVLSSALEAWEETVRVYECRRKSDGTRHELDEEKKVSVLEALCPQEIERHLQLLELLRCQGRTDGLRGDKARDAHQGF